MQNLRFHTEFILQTKDLTEDSLRTLITGLGEDIVINRLNNSESNFYNIKVNIRTQVPELVFDAVGQYGRLLKIKIDDLKK